MKTKYLSLFTGIAIGLTILASCYFWAQSIHELGNVLSK